MNTIVYGSSAVRRDIFRGILVAPHTVSEVNTPVSVSAQLHARSSVGNNKIITIIFTVLLSIIIFPHLQSGAIYSFLLLNGFEMFRVVL